MMMMVTEVVQVIHCVMSGWCICVIPIVWMLRMIEQMMIVVTCNEHRSSWLRWGWGVCIESRRGGRWRWIWRSWWLWSCQLMWMQMMWIGMWQCSMRMCEVGVWVWMLPMWCWCHVGEAIRGSCRRLGVVICYRLIIIVVVVVLQVMLKSWRWCLRSTCNYTRSTRFFSFAFILMNRRFLIN